MEDNKKYIDIVIRESLNERLENSIPSDLSERIMKRISRDKLVRSIFFDFSIKSIIVLLILAISIVVLLILGNQDYYWLNLLKSNFQILIGSLGILYFIFFLNEIIEKFLGERNSSQSRKYHLP